MRRSNIRTSLIFIIAIGISSIAVIDYVQKSIPTEGNIYGPYFCPEDRCSHIVINWISRANQSIEIAIYSFTLDSIGDALIEAHDRGVKVRVIMERDQVNRYSEYSKLKAAGIEVKLDGNDRLMHNKFVVIDEKIVLTGSYNFTKSADEYNDENLLVIVSQRIAEAYKSEFQEMWSGKFGC